MINYFELSKCSFARKTINCIPKIKQGKRHKESSKKDAFALLCGMTKNVTFTQHTKINIFSIIMTNLCIKQQRVTVWWTKTNRQPHFSWAEEFVIDPEGNVIKVADGSCVQKKKTQQEYIRGIATGTTGTSRPSAYKLTIQNVSVVKMWGKKKC